MKTIVFFPSNCVTSINLFFIIIIIIIIKINPGMFRLVSNYCLRGYCSKCEGSSGPSRGITIIDQAQYKEHNNFYSTISLLYQL